MHIKRIDTSNFQWVVKLFDQYRVFYGKPSNLPLAEAYIKERINNNESVIFVALEMENGQETPVGFTQLYPLYSSVRAVKDWILNDLYVDATQRRKGSGEQLIRAAMAFAKEEKATLVQLETAVDNYTAQSLYEAIGFKRQEPDSQYYVYRIELDQ